MRLLVVELDESAAQHSGMSGKGSVWKLNGLYGFKWRVKDCNLFIIMYDG